MVYLFLKEVAEATNPAELIIVVQSLCRDMNNSDAKSELYRANACRVLCRILDVRAPTTAFPASPCFVVP